MGQSEVFSPICSPPPLSSPPRPQPSRGGQGRGRYPRDLVQADRLGEGALPHRRRNTHLERGQREGLERSGNFLGVQYRARISSHRPAPSLGGPAGRRRTAAWSRASCRRSASRAASWSRTRGPRAQAPAGGDRHGRKGGMDHWVGRGANNAIRRWGSRIDGVSHSLVWFFFSSWGKTIAWHCLLNPQPQPKTAAPVAAALLPGQPRRHGGRLRPAPLGHGEGGGVGDEGDLFYVRMSSPEQVAKPPSGSEVGRGLYVHGMILRQTKRGPFRFRGSSRYEANAHIKKSVAGKPVVSPRCEWVTLGVSFRSQGSKEPWNMQPRKQSSVGNDGCWWVTPVGYSLWRRENVGGSLLR